MFLKLLFLLIPFICVNANLVPHKAHYDIKLKHVNENSDIERVRGKMIFEIKEEKN